MNLQKLNELEQRTYSCEVRAEEDEGNILRGRPIVFNSMTDLGWFNEIIERGALDKTDLKDVRFLVNHDTSKIPLARSRNNNASSTMRLMPNEFGMDIEVHLDTENNAEAASLYSAVKRGDITGMSFMFSVSEDEWEGLDTEHPTRHIRAISSVVEVSAVTFPAYESTEIYARSKEALENARSAVETARQRAHEDSVDTEEIELAKAKFNFILTGGNTK